MNPVKLGGTITHITYTKPNVLEDKTFVVAKIITDDCVSHTITGETNRAAEIGDFAIGNFITVTTPRFGEQLKSKGTIEIYLPRDAGAILKRCSSIATKNNMSLAPAMKTNIKNLAEQNPEEFWSIILAHTPLGINKPRWDEFRGYIKEYVAAKKVGYKSSLDVETYIRGLGLNWSEKVIRAIIGADEDCEEPGREQIVLSQLMADPLCLISVKQIKEKQIGEYLDALEKLGIIDKETIAVGLLIKQLRKAEGDGNSCIPVNELRVEPLRGHPVFEKYLCEYKEYIYRKTTFDDERVVAEFIVDCATSEPLDHLENADMMTLIKSLPPDGGKIPTDKQYAAVCQIFNRRISTVQGCAGSGKTTSLRALARFIKEYRPDIRGNILFLGPTGKAVQRIDDSISDIELSASDNTMTMHRLSGLIRKAREKPLYDSDSSTPIEDCISMPAIIVFEEASMISITTLAMTIRAIRTYGYIPHIVFMGDLYQLRPVGIGMPYKDIIDSGIVETSILDVVHRQGADSSLLKAITQIRKREDVSVRDDSFNIFKITEEKGRSSICKWATKTKGSIATIIVPTTLLMKELTPYIRDCVNPETPASILKIGDEVLPFRKGDKVMQIKNNYGRSVFNGTVGLIIGLAIVDKTRAPITDNEVDAPSGDVKYELHVRFDKRDNDFYYTFSEAFEELTFAYVMTTHKAQGSEYENTLIVMDRSIPGFINRSMIYTAASRGKESVTIMIKDIRVLSLWKDISQPPKTNLLDQILSSVAVDDSP
jgi:exodeoxyribonuclease V alpha subunit